MPATKARKALPGKRGKSTAPTKNRYRFESFSQRVANLSINPVTKARAVDIDETTDGLPVSHFVTTFARWRELNLSTHFVRFVGEVEPLSETLPQVVHYQDQIVDHLVSYTEQGDVYSLEPLLELASALAHDLGYQFERHFPRILAVILAATTAHTEVEVIEWSFSALAWLFKYLSRLIVPDVRPTFDVVAPYLGRSHHKPHIARFAAEALSFLIRKAAARRDAESLSKIVQHICQDIDRVLQDAENETYLYGVMTLFANAMKGVDQGLHSAASSILEALFIASFSSATNQIVVGVVINMIHHTDPESLMPLLTVVYSFANSNNAASTETSLELATESLFYVATVRDGVKILDWKPILESAAHLASITHGVSDPVAESISNMDKTLVAVLANASLDAVIPYMRRILDFSSGVRTFSVATSLLYLQDRNPHRFEDLVLPTLGESIRYGIEDGDEKLLFSHILLPVIQDKRLKLPEDAVTSLTQPLLDRYASLLTGISSDALPRINAYLDMIPFAPFDTQLRKAIVSEFERLVAGGNASLEVCRAIFGNGLRALLETEYVINSAKQVDAFLRLCAEMVDHPQLLQNLRVLHDRQQITLPNLQVNGVLPRLFYNLTSYSKDVRATTLDLLRNLAASSADAGSDLIEVAISVEELAADAHSTRKIAMFARQMVAIAASLKESAWLQPLLPHYCFGMMNFHLAEVWQIAIDSLRAISESGSGETLIVQILTDWLDRGVQIREGYEKSTPLGTNTFFANEFQCFKAENARRKFEFLSNSIHNPASYFEKNLEESLQQNPNRIEACTQALRILKGLPKLAEKKSRLFIPYFLEWTRPEQAQILNEEDENGKTSKHSKADTIAFLETLALFQNPRSLFRADEVYSALLALLSSSDSSIQTRALDAILVWKDPAVREFDEPLHHLLDDSRFRETLMDFTHTRWERLSTIEHREELMVVLLRLLFGRMTASLKSTSSSTQQGRRRTILEFLYKFEDRYIEKFLSIATDSVGTSLMSEAELNSNYDRVVSTDVYRRLLGLLKLIADMILVIGDRLRFIAVKILDVVLDSVGIARGATSDDADLAVLSTTSLQTTVRSQGLQCVVLWFQYLSVESLDKRVDAIFKLLIDEPTKEFAARHSQSVSHSFRLFSAWAETPRTKLLLVKDLSLLKCVAETLQLPFTKEDVKLFVLDNILIPMLDGSQDSPIASRVDEMHGYLISCCESLLQSDLSRHLLASTIKISLQLSPFIREEQKLRQMLQVLTLLVQRPSNQVARAIKIHILELMQKLLPSAALDPDGPDYVRVYDCLGVLLGTVADPMTRSAVCQTLAVLTKDHDRDRDVAMICSNLSSYSSTELDRVDYEKRRGAYDKVCSEAIGEYNMRQLTPLMQTLLFFAKDAQDYDNSTNARIAICTIVGRLGSGSDERLRIIPEVLLPAVRLGVRSDEEEVRKNCFEIIAQTVHHHSDSPELSDLTPLLMGGDEEASIFNNIFHVQQHRRIRALRRLASRDVARLLSSKNVAQILLPLLEHLVFDRDDDSKAGDVASEAIITIGSLAYQLDWTQARAVLRRYTKFISTKPGYEKSTFRLLAVLIDAVTESSRKREAVAETQIPEEDSYPLMQSISRSEKLSADILGNLLPPLVSYLHHKDESVVSLRAPVAISVAKILMVLPSAAIISRLPPVLTDICHILRSRTVESRDLVRKTLAEISQVIGAKYFGFIIKELRAALARGYQLHVLSYTAHTLLVEAIPSFEPGDLDYCVGDLSGIIMDDIFGTTGKEKDADEYTGKMKEIKGRKSFDSMELLASNISISNLSQLVQPIQTLLLEKLDLKTLRKADELLRRFATGLAKNDGASTRESLVFCYELIQRAYSNNKAKGSQRASKRDRFLVNLNGKKANNYGAAGTLYDSKFLSFAFDLVRMLVQKHEALRTPSNLSGFLPAIGDAILKSHEDVQVASMRLLATILKVPIPDLDKNGPVYLAEATSVLKQATSLNTELVQAALKLVTAYMRDRTDAKVNEKDITEILVIVTLELDRSESQGMVFNFLRSVLGRNIVVTEVYEVMDNVATMMVTHMSRDTRAMARSTYIQFLLNYPQGSKRLQKQIGFLRSNLQYPHVEGRQAIMEAIHVLLPRVDQDLQQDIITTFFNPLILVLVNDDSNDCRKMAGLLLESLLKFATEENASLISAGISKWLSQDENLVLLRAGFQAHSIILDVAPRSVDQQRLRSLRDAVCSTIGSYALNAEEPTWELLYYALQLWKRIMNSFEDFGLDAETHKLWTLIQQTMSFPHKWVKTISATLVETYLSDFTRMLTQDADGSWPIQASHGLSMTHAQALYCLRRSLKGLQSPELTEELADQLIRDAVLLAQIGQAMPAQDRENDKMIDENEESDSEHDEPELLQSEGTEKAAMLEVMFQGISHMIRAEPAHSKASALIPRHSALRLCQTLCNGLPIDKVRPYIYDIMLPLYILVDPSIPTPFSIDQGFLDGWKEQVSTARDILDLIRSKIGTSDFLAESSKIQRRIREKRNERRAKRKLAAIKAPERTGKEKQKKGERKKQRRKEKGMEFRERRRGW